MTAKSHNSNRSCWSQCDKDRFVYHLTVSLHAARWVASVTTEGHSKGFYIQDPLRRHTTLTLTVYIEEGDRKSSFLATKQFTSSFVHLYSWQFTSSFVHLYHW